MIQISKSDLLIMIGAAIILFFIPKWLMAIIFLYLLYSRLQRRGASP